MWLRVPEENPRILEHRRPYFVVDQWIVVYATEEHRDQPIRASVVSCPADRQPGTEAPYKRGMVHSAVDIGALEQPEDRNAEAQHLEDLEEDLEKGLEGERSPRAAVGDFGRHYEGVRPDQHHNHIVVDQHTLFAAGT